MPDVFYVKLVGGEQILTQLADINDDVARLDNPLELSFQESVDGRCLIYLSRYLPFVGGAVDVKRSHVVHIEPATAVAAEYYEVSLVYCLKRSDLSFVNGITEATRYMAGKIDEIDQPLASNELVDQTDDGIFIEDFDPSKKHTFH